MNENNLQVLYVDSSSSSAQSYREITGGCSLLWQPALACSAKEAHTILSGGKYDVVVIDISIEDPEAIDLIKHFDNIPAIRVTDSKGAKNISRALQHGFTECIARDNQSEFLEMLPVLVEKASAQGKLQREIAYHRQYQAQLIANQTKDLEREILQQSTTEETLRISESTYRNLIDIHPYGIQLSDARGKIILSNRVHQAMYGYSPNQLIGKFIWDLTENKEEKERVKQFFIDIVNNRVKPTPFFSIGKTLSGKLITTRTDWSYVIDEEDSIIAILSVVSDITDQRRTEKSLQIADIILTATKDMMSFIDKDYTYRFVNKAYLTAYNRTRSEIVDQPIARFFDNDVYTQFIKPNLDRAFSGENVQYQAWFDYPDGVRRYKDVIYQPFQQGHTTEGVVVSVHDLTKQKAAEEKHETLAREWQQTFDSSDDAICCLNEDFRIVRSNRKMDEMFGHDKPLVGRVCWEAVHGSDSPIEDCPAMAAKHSHKREVRVINKDGRWLQVTVDPIINNSGTFEGVVHNIQDITERKKLEAATEAQRNRILLDNKIANIFLTEQDTTMYENVLVTVLESLTCSIGFLGICNDEGNCSILAQKGALAPFFSYLGDEPDVTQHRPEPEIKSSSLKKLFADKTCSCHSHHFNNARSHIIFAPLIYRKTRIGLFMALRTDMPFTPNEKELMQSGANHTAPILYSIKEKQRFEARYRQVQKVESIGRLAGGVAHDLNNMLTPILGFSEVMIDEIPKDHHHQELLQEIVEAGTRSRDMVRQLLAFGRKQDLQFRPLDLNTLVREFLKLLTSTLRENIIIELQLNSDIPMISGDKGQLEQIIMNLAVNSQDAMPNGGQLFLRTRTVTINSDQTRPGLKTGEWNLLEVQDTGTGIAPEICENIFEPFYTTKDIDQGTGLGLATVYGIVKQHSGSIYLDSTIGQGSTFSIYLPPQPELPRERTTPAPPNQTCAGTETILLVEDNDQVRKLASSILARNGYNVIEGKNGDEALKLHAETGKEIHLLLTDIIMPGITGKELYERIANERPTMKVLYMSGYTDEVIGKHGTFSAEVNFIRKPFAINDLTQKVRSILDTR